MREERERREENKMMNKKCFEIVSRQMKKNGQIRRE
jgi:hypothetical protein